MLEFLKRKPKVDNELSEETHDIYAWTEYWDDDTRPLFNCTKDKVDGFEHRIDSNIDLEISKKVDPMERLRIIYFFGPKAS